MQKGESENDDQQFAMREIILNCAYYFTLQKLHTSTVRAIWRRRKIVKLAPALPPTSNNGKPFTLCGSLQQWLLVANDLQPVPDSPSIGFLNISFCLSTEEFFNVLIAPKRELKRKAKESETFVLLLKMKIIFIHSVLTCSLPIFLAVL